MRAVLLAPLFAAGLLMSHSAIANEDDVAKATAWLVDDLMEGDRRNAALAEAMAACVLDTLTPQDIADIANATSEDGYVAVMRRAEVPPPVTFTECGEGRL